VREQDLSLVLFTSRVQTMFGSSPSSSSSSPYRFVNDEDSFLDSLLENIDFIDQIESRVQSVKAPFQPTSTITPSSHPAIVPNIRKKRPFEELLSSSEIISSSSLSSSSDDDDENRGKNSSSNSSIALPGYKNQPIAMPRIVKTDIRRRYSFMFANVLNSYDCHLIDSFIQRFSEPSISFEKENMHDTSVALSGTTMLSTYFCLSQQMSPDKVVRITDTQIKQRSDRTGSELVSNFDVSLTKIYDVHPTLIADSVLCQFQDLSVENKKNSSSLIINDNNGCEGKERRTTVVIKSDLFQSVDLARPHLSVMKFPRLSQPRELHVKGKLIFSLNDQKRIEKIAIKFLGGSFRDLPAVHC
jgi:hypothetical protein